MRSQRYLPWKTPAIFVAHMPAPVADLEEWKKLHMSKDKQEPDPAWTENMEKIRREAEAKKGQLQ